MYLSRCSCSPNASQQSIWASSTVALITMLRVGSPNTSMIAHLLRPFPSPVPHLHQHLLPPYHPQTATPPTASRQRAALTTFTAAVFGGRALQIVTDITRATSGHRCRFRGPCPYNCHGYHPVHQCTTADFRGRALIIVTDIIPSGAVPLQIFTDINSCIRGTTAVFRGRALTIVTDIIPPLLPST